MPQHSMPLMASISTLQWSVRIIRGNLSRLPNLMYTSLQADSTDDRRPSTDDPRRVKETGRVGRKRRRQRQKGADSRLISPNGSNWFTSIDFGQQLALLVTDFSRLVPAFPDFPLFISQLPRTFAACDKCSLWGIKLVKENSDDVWNWDGMERSGWNAKETTREIPRGK